MGSVLILGDGLLGSQFKKYGIPVISREDCDITDPFDVDAVFTKYRPQVVLNCAGVVPRSPDHSDVVRLFKTNALGPRILANACDSRGIRLISLSSDCAFSGRKGNYSEIETPDTNELYGLSKAVGEIVEFPHLTVRTSFIGFPDVKGRGLLAWASQQKVITGYDKVLWNGLTVNELVKLLIETVIPMELSNVIHLYGETVSKYDILKEFKLLYGFDYQLIKESEVEENPHISDKTLSSMLPEIQTKLSFREMMQEMKNG